ncbi:protein lin-37 homolog [Armigeres subalbatus]|uniref:protein lin-37 homolog n=1 Tax=Armigeres subalbatus TaxID=124917 RepID=UPI002ED23D66
MSKRRNLLDSAEKRRSLQNVAVARGRLKGALADIMTHSDDESDSDDPNTTRQLKRSKTTSSLDPIPIPHQSYIMKLFDRSVDLARFDEATPLYPICRAWMQNQPRANPKLLRTPSPVKRERNPRMVDQYLSGELKEIRAMPRPEVSVVDRCPLPLPSQTRTSKELLEVQPMSKAELLDEHRKRWCQIRHNWEHHGSIRNERHAASFELLDALLKGNV